MEIVPTGSEGGELIMKLYSNEALIEGEEFPVAWLWSGKLLSHWGKTIIGTVFLLRLPWWTRQTLRMWGRDQPRDVTCQLALIMDHIIGGGPEVYKFIWLPEREEF